MLEARRTTNILGVKVDAINLDSAIARVEGWIAERRQCFGIFRDVHGVMLSRRDPRLLSIHRKADLVAPDGMPLVWLSRVEHGAIVRRVYGPDFMRTFCKVTANRGYRHYFYGAAPGTPEMLVERLRMIDPNLVVVGTMSPPFRALTTREDADIVEHINGTHPNIVWVGLSTPKQEYWMAEHVGRISAAALLGVGAAFDFVAGTKRQAPRWIQRSGFEWLYRAVTEPRRLALRYAQIVPLFAVLAVGQVLGIIRPDKD